MPPIHPSCFLASLTLFLFNTLSILIVYFVIIVSPIKM